MAKKKKRPNKKAKAALKILEESKLLEGSKTTASKNEEDFRSKDSSLKTSTAFKSRPPKKRA